MKLNYLIRAALFSALTSLIGSLAIASPMQTSAKVISYKIQTKILIDGKLISSPVVIATSNQLAIVKLADKQSNLKMQVIASENKNDRKDIHLKYDIHYTSDTQNIHTRPQMIVLSNQEGDIKFATANGHTFEMSVVAVRK